MSDPGPNSKGVAVITATPFVFMKQILPEFARPFRTPALVVDQLIRLWALS